MHRLFSPYRAVLALPGTRGLLVVALLARIPGTAKGMLLTLHVVLDQHRGYGAAGLVTMAMTLGAALGSPLIGRMTDRRGLRPVLVLTGAVECLYWLAVPLLPYPALVAATLVGGFFAVPVFQVIRQAVAAHVPEAQRRQAFALDSMIVETAFMVGPAVAVLAVTGEQTAVPALWTLSVLTLASVLGLWPLWRMLSRRQHPGGDTGAAAAPARGIWLDPALLLTLALCVAANLVLSGTEVSLVATLRSLGQTEWAGVTIIFWCVASLTGGFWHGSTERPRRLQLLMLVLGAATVPIGVIGGFGWQWACLALLPAGFFCAPTIASTAEAISQAVPASMRGQAMGMQGSALTLGGALGAPLAGAVIDRTGPAWGFAVTGAIGAVLALAAIVYRPGAGRVAEAAA
ncbi:MFS transporter [Streptacidiphilus monticola]|uniref:MFS transporter n=1 Tax=Streptacidiphilus monticola TaxID=2161674 RepID=A0ABW1G0X6_9ACTN